LQTVDDDVLHDLEDDEPRKQRLRSKKMASASRIRTYRNQLSNRFVKGRSVSLSIAWSSRMPPPA
jgi:hypothetical protein